MTHAEVRVIRHQDYPVGRWKNGLGETREIARHPQTGQFDWRVSMATVAQESEFSRFPGIDRLLGVAEGELIVTVNGIEHELAAGAEPLSFSGTDPVSARPVGDSATDVNLMVRRGGAVGELTTLGAGTHQFGAGQLVVIAVADSVELRAPAAVRLGRLDAWLVRSADPQEFELHCPGSSDVLAYAAHIR